MTALINSSTSGLPSVKLYDILLVEDSDADAEWVQFVLAEKAGFHVETVDYLSKAIGLLEKKHYDLILSDLTLPDASGLDAVVKLKRASRQTPIVILTGLDNEQLGVMAVQRGVQDYLVKGLDRQRFMQAVRYAMERARKFVTPDTNSRTGSHPDAEFFLPAQHHQFLSAREVEVLTLLDAGCTNHEIAMRLNICLTTVKSHVSNILQKLGATSRAKALVIARHYGIIQLEQ